MPENITQDILKTNKIKDKIQPIKLSEQQKWNYKNFGKLNKPEISQTYLNQGRKLTNEEQNASNKKLSEQGKLQDYQKQKQLESQQLEKAATVLPYIIPGMGQMMWAGKAVDLTVNGASNGKYKSWGNAASQITGDPEWMGDLTNPGYYAGAFPKLISKGIQSTTKYALQKAEPYLMGDKRILMMNEYKPKMSFVENGIENGIDAKTFGTNRIFEGKPLMISSNENAFKTTAGKFYRLTGQPQIDDIANNGGYVLAKRGKIKGGRFGETHWSKADGHTYNPNEGGYLIEADNIVNNQVGGIPSNSVNIYKVNNGKWELHKPADFKSEINWGNWNKEIPSNKPLMDEYLQIEKNAKQNGTWMKNSDGSSFQGTPEQFVQQNSKNFKKAYPQNAEITYRGIKNNTPDLLNNSAIFTADKRLAKTYTTNNEILTPFSTVDDKGLYEMYRKKSDNGIELDVRGSHWKNLNISNKIIPRSYFKKQIGNQKNNLKYNNSRLSDHNLDVAEIPYLLNNKKHLENELKYFQDGLLNRKDMINRKGVTNLKKHFKNLENTSTNDIAKYVENKNLDYIKLKNVSDNLIGTETIVNHKPGNYLKSAIGNNGMFDMLNPNIYKGLIPAAGLYGLTQSKKQGGILKRKNPNRI